MEVDENGEFVLGDLLGEVSWVLNIDNSTFLAKTTRGGSEVTWRPSRRNASGEGDEFSTQH